MSSHHHHRRHRSGVQTKHHKSIQRKDAYKALIAVVVLAVVLGGVAWAIGHWENARFQIAALENTPVSSDSSRTIELDGVTYIPKEHIETYLFLGIDVEGPAEAIAGYIGGGQADVQMVLVIDHEEQSWQLLQLNRDTMVDVPVLGVTGKVVGKKFEQLCLAHSYGDGLKESCVNTVNTVSSLLWDQPMDGYLSLNMDGIAILNDAVGGVPVTITSDFSAVDDSLVLGETVTLTGAQAEIFVRSRKDVDDETNVSRMARQRQYLSALFDKLPQLDHDTILDAYDQVYDYTVTDLGSQTVVNIADTLKAYTAQDVLTIDGESRVEEGYNAFYLDENSLQSTILTLFYNRR